MRKIIQTQPQYTNSVSIESLKEIGFMAEFLNQPPSPTISNEGMFDFFKDMFRTRISSHANPYEIKYSSRDLDRVRSVMRKTILDPKWMERAKISAAKFPHENYFQMLSVPAKPFDFNDPVGYISGNVKNQKHAFNKWVSFMEGRMTNMMKHHSNLQSEWPELEQHQKSSRMSDTLELIFSEYPTAKEYNSVVSPDVTMGGPTTILPGKRFPRQSDVAVKIGSVPALTIEQLPVIAEYVLQLVDTLAETDTSYQDMSRVSVKIMSHLLKTDQVLMWAYTKDKDLFGHYAGAIYYETHFDWIPGHTWELPILRILLAWIIHSVGEKI